jgi:fructose/tagatose bisphosphate aldolase
LEGVLTTPEQALEFVNTGIDFLEPAFGNIHGAYGPKGPRGWLEFERLEKVRKAVEGKVKILVTRGRLTCSLEPTRIIANPTQFNSSIVKCIYISSLV